LVALGEVERAAIPDGEKYVLLASWDEVLGLDLDRAVRKCFEIPTNIQQLINKQDRKSTRLNSSHVAISYAVFCLKKKKKKIIKKLKTKILMIVYRKMR